MRTIVLALIVFSGIAQSAQAALPSPKKLIAEIDANGPRAVVNRLGNDEASFDAVCAAIESGSAAWLEVARRLKPGSDASASLSLRYSVARALPKAPQRVLGLIGHGFSADEICTSPYIEPEPGVAKDYQRRTVKALKSVVSPGLIDVRNQCLAGVSIPLRPR